MCITRRCVYSIVHVNEVSLHHFVSRALLQIRCFLHFKQLRSFNASLVEVESAYQQSLQGIEAQYQSRESYSNVLEKEMSAALK